MTKRVALAEDTYARLGRNRRPGESFSDTIERLLDHQAKDPLAFRRALPPLHVDSDPWLRQIEADREASWTDA